MRYLSHMNETKNLKRERNIPSPEASPEADCVWSRLPKPGETEPRSGLNRAAINSLILGENPKVKSTTIRRHPDAKRCIRLVKISGPGGLLEYLDNGQ